MKIQDMYLGSKKVGEIFQESLGLDDDYVQHLPGTNWVRLEWHLLKA